MTTPLLITRVVMRAPTYRVNPYVKTGIPARAELHLMNRMGCGWSRTTWRQMRRVGGQSAWFERQLHPLAGRREHPRDRG